MGRLIKGYWDCRYCQTKGIDGGTRDCPNCGKPRDSDVRFYMKSKTDYVEEKLANTINRNLDWICSYCDSLNSDSNKNCVSCGASKEESELNYLENKANKKNEETDEESYEKNHSSVESVYNCNNKTNCDDIKNESNIIKLKSFAKKHYIKFISVFVVIGIICGITALLIPKNVHLSVTGVYWERSIDIEKYQTVDESGWTLPSDARLKYKRSEIYDYIDVLDHYETQTRYVEKERIVGYEEKVVGYNDLGNGYFEEITEDEPIYETYFEEETYTKPIYREEPVYKTKYYYEIDKWLYERSIKTSGDNKDVYWGEIDLKETERTASKHEKYFVYGKDANDESFEFYLDYNKWTDIQIGNEYEVNISIGGKGEIIN